MSGSLLHRIRSLSWAIRQYELNCLLRFATRLDEQRTTRFDPLHESSSRLNMPEDESMLDAPPLKKLDKGKGKQAINGKIRDAIDDENLPWVEKYRPKDMNDVVSHQDIIGTSQCAFINV